MIGKTALGGIPRFIHLYIKEYGKHPTDFKDFAGYVAKKRADNTNKKYRPQHQENRIQLWIDNLDEIQKEFDRCLVLWNSKLTKK